MNNRRWQRVKAAEQAGVRERKAGIVGRPVQIRQKAQSHIKVKVLRSRKTKSNLTQDMNELKQAFPNRWEGFIILNEYIEKHPHEMWLIL